VLRATFDGGPIVTSSETDSSSENWTFVTPQPGPGSFLAEDKRFELLRGCPQHAFQACALGH
jgi:hypothetical protein